MWANTKQLYGKKLGASDGDLGHVKDFYFDDDTWVVRYVVADTGSWLAGRLVLLSPHAFGKIEQEGKALLVDLSRKQIEGSPSIETHKPVSRQYEEDYHRYYGWPAYWEGSQIWGMGGFPLVPPPGEAPRPPRARRKKEDVHLRSTQAVTGYQVQAIDGTIGHVSGFLVDDKSWAVREVAAETGHWYAGKEILIAPRKITRISDAESKVFVNLTKEDIRLTAEGHVVHPAAGSSRRNAPKEVHS